MTLRHLLLAVALSLCSCGANEERDAGIVFAELFGRQSEPGVEVAHGFRMSGRQGMAESGGLLLHLRGPAVLELLERKWPDLRRVEAPSWTFIPDPKLEVGWFKPLGRDYQHWESASDGRLYFYQDLASDDFYIAKID